MKTIEVYNKYEKMVCFEVPNTFLTRRTAISIVSKIPEVVVLRINKREEAFCTFKLGSRTFDLWEPFGDNSRFHIGEKVAEFSNELETIKKEFSKYKPWPMSLFSR